MYHAHIAMQVTWTTFVFELGLSASGVVRHCVYALSHSYVLGLV